ncbi:bifunctional oligoribonuclease/PAP phosphatase NrnA [Candidatus Woesebacteria bacterium]|nr:MAG: bifunctional oligoribonuclease/PAP phosphatase NrnA [Candidatus Woesebacteria bacterium]
MHYDKSRLIFDEISKASNILINCHRGPDPDSIGSAISLSRVLSKLGKQVEIVCPTELDSRLNFLPDFKNIQPATNFKTFDFSKYDLLIFLDSSSWDMVSGDLSIPLPTKPIILIDHHLTNTHFGKINLVDDKVSSVGELLFLIYSDWKIKLDNKTATALLTAIIGDTGVFRYSNTSSQTLRIAGDLLKLKADKELIVRSIYQDVPINDLRFTGEVLRNIKLNKKHRFVWGAVPYSVLKTTDQQMNAKELAVSIFAQCTKDTDFGLLMYEKEPENLSVTFRSRSNLDVSKMATILGGGGHKVAAGGSVHGLPFDKAVKKVIKIACKFATENSHTFTK